MDRIEDRKIDGLCDIEPAAGPECRCGYRLPFHCGHCGLPFPTLNDYRQIDGHRCCLDCADMLRVIGRNRERQVQDEL
jgi:hypothetical protein